ncbi:reverse transcriptase domain-containing protein [Tanacetum coccineum]
MFTCQYGTFAYKRMPFGLSNAPATFQLCMMATFHELIEESMEVFVDDFSVFGNSFDHCLENLEKMLKRCEETNLVLNWGKCNFMVKEGIVLGHKESGSGIEEFDIKIRDKKGAENLIADHLSRLENPDLGKLTMAEIQDLFPEQQLMKIFDNRMRQLRFFDNVIVVLQEDIMGLPPLQEIFLKSGSTSLISFAQHENWSDLVTHVIGLATFLQGMKHLKSIFRIIYGKACHLPFELEHKAMWALKAYNIDLTKDRANRVLQISELDELRLDAYESSTLIKKGRRNGTINGLRYQSSMKKGISRDMKGGAIEPCDKERNEFIVNKQHVKPYQKDISNLDADDDVTLDDEEGVT